MSPVLLADKQADVASQVIDDIDNYRMVLVLLGNTTGTNAFNPALMPVSVFKTLTGGLFSMRYYSGGEVQGRVGYIDNTHVQITMTSGYRVRFYGLK